MTSIAPNVETLNRTHAPDRSIERQIVEHVIKAVRATEASDDPYCHYYVEDVFPEHIYAEILCRLPDTEHYRPLNLKEWSRANGESTRDRLFLSEEGVSTLPVQDRDFWLSVARALTSDTLKQVIFRKLAKDIALRFNCREDEVADIEAFPRAVLMRDTEGYRIKPHPDGTNRIVTMLYYLPPDDSQEDLGTSVYFRQPWIRRLLGDSFREVRRFPFRRNSSCAFVVNRLPNKTSWHGRELVGADAGVRNLILCQYRVNDDGQSY
ncbi:MAG: hypothetical protein MPJ78_13005 [Hyphomicrobiaceae bacterium]|nr:hypothetical protein [Hyphomicrobiaceae bacterium]